MKAGGTGGGNTTTGLKFEQDSDLLNLLSMVEGYEIADHEKKVGVWILYEGKRVARSFRKHAFYKFLDEMKIPYKDVVSAKLLPDDALLIFVRDTLFIVEVKYQQVAGSVDEKLQTCDYKKKYYSRLFAGSKYLIEYVYVLNRAWFDKPKYKDVLDYIISVGCHYHFDVLPLKWLSLPVPDENEPVA